MTIVMGLDQHRAQIMADRLNTETGEISRARVTPAHRDSVRQFLGRFAGQQLEAALEATTGWRSWSTSAGGWSSSSCWRRRASAFVRQ